MSRKQFIESQGATCRNWTWSWSFINEDKKFVIFGAWDRNTDGNTTLIFSQDWEFGEKGKRPGYDQSREHVRLVEEEGYTLMTFPMKYSDAHKDEDGNGPAKIDGFEPILTKRFLKRVGGSWYASDDHMSIQLPEEIPDPKQFTEGASKTITVNVYERNVEARSKCIEHYGYVCAACDFDFAATYGSIGENFIHVHHVVPLADIKKEYVLNPIEHLRPLCPNCHAIVHRTTPVMDVEVLREHLAQRKAEAA